MEFVSLRVNQFFSEKAKEADFKHYLLLCVCGYSSGHLLPEVWQVGSSNRSRRWMTVLPLMSRPSYQRRSNRKNTTGAVGRFCHCCSN
jgi:hypothetical protein